MRRTVWFVVVALASCSNPPPADEAFYRCEVKLHDPMLVPQPGERVAIADFNHDQRADLVTTLPGDDQFAVVLANADGSFDPATTYATGDVPFGVVAADFDQDSHIDVAVTNAMSNSVSVRLGLGDGTFGPSASYATGEGAQAIVVGDLDKNGLPDLVIADRGSSVMNGSELASTLTVLTNQGGTFSTYATLSTDYSPEAVEVGDFDANGTQDIVATSVWTNSACVFLNNGNGTFASKQCIYAGDIPVGVAVADYDGDHHLDIAVACLGGLPEFANIEVHFGAGDGTFSSRSSYPTDDIQQAIVAGDFDSDGAPDLAFTDGWNASTSVMRNHGDGTFEPIESYAGSEESGGHFALADMNNDAKLDLAVATRSGIILLQGKGNSSFDAQRIYPVRDAPLGGELADLDRDGRVDIVVANRGNVFHENEQLRILFGTTADTFTTVGIPLAAPNAVAVGDATGDAIPDLLVASAGGVTVLVGDGARGFTAQMPLAPGAATDVALADFDADGHLDAAVLDGLGVNIFLGLGHGQFAAPTTEPIDAPSSMVVDDLDGDHKLDLVLADSGGVSVLLGKGNGRFGPPTHYTTSASPAQIALGHASQTSDLDIVAACPSAGTIEVLRNNGDGTFASAVSYAAGLQPTGITVGDVTGDHQDDLVVADRARSTQGPYAIRVLERQSDGTFVETASYRSGVEPVAVLLGDINADDHRDIVTFNFGSQGNGSTGTVGVLLESCALIPTPD